MIKIFALTSVILMSFEVTGQVARGPTFPLPQYDERSCNPDSVQFVADQLNMCWYYSCVQKADDLYGFAAMECPLGTRLAYGYTAGISNPCTYRFEGDIGYECSRERDFSGIQKPACADTLRCMNGGTLNVDEVTGQCWCVCPNNWQGHNDCSKFSPIVLDSETNAIVPSADKICADGRPPRDYCSEVGGCLNDGLCTNQCDGFWCDCPSPFRFGKRCERFSCRGSNECYNGGTCRRGITGLNEFRRCQCTTGFFGFKCEKSIDDLPFSVETPDPLGRPIGR